MSATFGDLIRRHRAGGTQEDFAQRLAAGGLALSRQAVQHWEVGRACPELRTINALCAALGLSAGERVDLIDAASRYQPHAPAAPEQAGDTDDESTDDAVA